ncbi:MAG: type IV pilin [Methanocalculaceae archaeon]|jgi:FlaG/FlaF family flagellin (archaellin)|nr:type IV pilin [Methanocalculaceae archaeon]
MEVIRVNRKDDAVSPAIATILLVTVVVVIAAIVAVVALGMVGGDDPKNVGMTVTSDYRNATVTLFTGIDVSTLEELRVSAVSGNTVSRNDTGIKSIGMPLLFKSVGGTVAGTTLVTVTGKFLGGTEVVLWQGNLAFKSHPWGIESKKKEGTGYYHIYITVPHGWSIDDVYSDQLRKQLKLEIRNGNGDVVNAFVESGKSSIIEGFYLFQGKIDTTESEQIKRELSGSYTLYVYEQTVDQSNNIIVDPALISTQSITF